MKDLFLDCARNAALESEEKLVEVLDQSVFQQRSLVDDVLDTQLVDEERFLENLSKKLSIGWKEELERDDVKPRQLRELCSAQVALRHRLLPVYFDDPDASEDDEFAGEGGEERAANGEGTGRLEIATYDPFNLTARQAASQHIKVPIQWRMASRTRIVEGLQSLYGVGADTFEQLLAGRDLNEDLLDMREDVNVIDDDDEEASVVKFVNQILREALDQRATDIHVEPQKNQLRIRYRVDGKLVEVPVPENIKALQSMVVARLKIMSNLDIAERRLPQDGRINLQIEGKSIDVRVATIPTVEGEQVSLRLLGQEQFNLKKLNLGTGINEQFRNLLELSNGIILLTGPTGCGKSTTLYTFLTELNKSETRIVTVEDPVENKLEGILQVAVKPEINLTFANGLRSFLRADPDIIMVGEIRDLETAEIAIRAALTGHLVFSTLHTNDAIGGISRLVDMGLEPFLVSASVRAFIAQRLVRKLCPTCRVETSYKPEYLRSVDFPADYTGPFYEKGGCQACRNSGYRGRLAIYEVCMLTAGLQEMVTAGRPYSALKEQAIKDGFLPMRGYGYAKVMEGQTTLEEVVSVTTTEMEGT
ncbi:GspE/PulE family protein [Verrucomicrobiales bacterium]|jgi:type II secretory ATPase GspE/PulE/Tfp pilus assembly ATPase PilB-like protein|nr:GspE/PulE family protein [Verrucomicrobiales bacterium]MDF1789329.1 GspE/PulE family protein [Verrucomicrobiales bacterium]